MDHRTFLRAPLDAEGSNEPIVQHMEPIVQHMAEITSPHVAMMARLSLESELAEHADPRDLTEARQLADNMRWATKRAKDKRLDLRLHELIAVASGNPLLAELHS
ncbi:MAG: FCD domain-containing protein [Boseongicola sp.]|nr:FCD domain-containing protein [Boseongicola sp.]